MKRTMKKILKMAHTAPEQTHKKFKQLGLKKYDFYLLNINFFYYPLPKQNIHFKLKAKTKIGTIARLLLLLVSFVLSWKLFRLAYPIEMLWNIHNYLIIFFALISLTLAIKHNFYLERSKTTIIVLFFILLSVTRLALFPSPNPFFVASMVFCLYFSMLTIFMRSSLDYGFKCFEILLVLLLFYNFLDYFLQIYQS